MRLRMKRIPLMEPDSDGPYRIGWTWGIEVVNEDGDVLNDPQAGTQGPMDEIRRLVNVCNAALDALDKQAEWIEAHLREPRRGGLQC